MAYKHNFNKTTTERLYPPKRIKGKKKNINGFQLNKNGKIVIFKSKNW